jgi:hypothetical protein
MMMILVCVFVVSYLVLTQSNPEYVRNNTNRAPCKAKVVSVSLCIALFAVLLVTINNGNLRGAFAREETVIPHSTVVSDAY